MMLATQAAVPTLVVVSDIRTGLPGGADEREGGDGAAAFVMASEAVVGDAMQLRPIAAASASAEFLDRWRLPGEPASHVWEERFGEHAYLPLVQAAFTDALKAAGIGPDALDHVIVTGVHTRAVRAATRALGVAPEAIVDDLASTIGFTGTAHAALLLAGVLERAEPGQRIATVSIADGQSVRVRLVPMHESTWIEPTTWPRHRYMYCASRSSGRDG